MSDGIFKEAKAIYYYGGKIKLGKSWRADDAVCRETKLYYVTDGEIIVETDDVSFEVCKGEMAVIPAGVKHSYRLSERGYARKYWCHFDMMSGGRDVFSGLGAPSKVRIGDSAYADGLFETLLKYSGRNTPESCYAVTGALLLIVSCYIENGGLCTITGHRDDADIEAAFRLAEQSGGENIGLEELAKTAHLSPNYFIRKFKERVGVTPVKYLNAMKIERAKSMLENTDLTVSEIMTEIGIYDAAYFCKLFKASTGYSPRAWRDVYRKKAD